MSSAAFNVLLKSHGKSNRVKEDIRGIASYHFNKDVYGREFRAKIADFGKSRHLGAQAYIETSSYGTITHMVCDQNCLAFLPYSSKTLYFVIHLFVF